MKNIIREKMNTVGMKASGLKTETWHAVAFPEIFEFKKDALKTALGTLLQLFSKGSSEEMESILDQWGP